LDVLDVFFFQAEDGIRDFHVTGVQTCALPIWVAGAALSSMSFSLTSSGYFSRSYKQSKWIGFAFRSCGMKSARMVLALSVPFSRSEERRVGKECRSGALGDH